MYNVLDLFAGAGGMSLGFQQQGNFRIIGVIENNENALETFCANHKKDNPKVDRDIRKINFEQYKQMIGTVDVIIGGPPCQGFSNANRQKTKFISMNNSLVKRYVDAVLSLKPNAFVMENVAMLKSDVHKFFDSNIDHDEILQLGIEMKEEPAVIMNQNPDGIQMLDTLNNRQLIERYYLPEELFNGIKVIRRYYKNDKKQHNYFNKYSSTVIKALSEYVKKYEDNEIGAIVKNYIKVLQGAYIEKIVTDEFKIVLDKFIEFVRAISLMKELYDNDVIINSLEELDGKIIAKLSSYTVYDYLEKRIKGEYKIDDGILNAADFGAPQERKRFILIGLKTKLTKDKEIKLPKTTEVVKNTVRDAIEDLAIYNPNKSVEDAPIKRENFSKNAFTSMLQANEKQIYNHVNTDTRKTAQKRFENIEPGKNFHSLDASMKEDTYSDPTRTQNTIYLRLEYDKPCGTVVNVRKSMWIHPTEDRAISIREAARLQTFPDNYIFYGSKDSQYQQIGNAVPPILARAIAEKINELLKEG